MAKQQFPHFCPICGYKWKSYFEKPSKCANCEIILTIAQEIADKNLNSVQGMTKAVERVIHNDKEPVPADTSTDDEGNPARTPVSKKRQCPFCKKWIYTEYAQKHYSDSHEGAQI